MFFCGKTGFTLIELLIAIVVILIIAGTVSSRLDTSFQKHKLDNDGKKLASSIELAQQYALSQKGSHKYYGIVFYGGGYRIVPYDEVSIPLPPISVPNSINADGDIPFSRGVTASGQGITFDSRGSLTVSNDAQIILENRAGRRTINVSSLTGYVEVK